MRKWRDYSAFMRICVSPLLIILLLPVLSVLLTLVGQVLGLVRDIGTLIHNAAEMIIDVTEWGVAIANFPWEWLLGHIGFWWLLGGVVGLFIVGLLPLFISHPKSSFRKTTDLVS